MVVDIHCSLGMFFSDVKEASLDMRVDKGDVVVVLCPLCKNVGRNPKTCDSCKRDIPVYALRTSFKANGDVFDLTRMLNPNYLPYPSGSQEKEKVTYHIKNPEFTVHNRNKEKCGLRERYSSLPHGNRRHIFETARSVIQQQQNNEKEETKEDRCSFGKHWKYCSRCNPQLQNGNKTHEGKCTEEDLKVGMQLTVKSMELSDSEDEERVSISVPGFMQHHNKFSHFEGEDSNIKGKKKRADAPFMLSPVTMGMTKAIGPYKSKGYGSSVDTYLTPKKQRIGNIINSKNKSDSMTFASLSDWYASKSQSATGFGVSESEDYLSIFPENDNPLNTKNKLIKNRRLINMTSTPLPANIVKKDHLVNTTEVSQASSSISADQKETNLAADNLKLTKDDGRIPAWPSQFCEVSVDCSEKNPNTKKSFVNSLKKENNAIANSPILEGSSNTSFHLKKSSMGPMNLNSKLKENKTTVMLSSSKILPVVSSNTLLPCRDRNMDTENVKLEIDESKTPPVASSSMIPFKNQQFIKDTNKCDGIMEIRDENCQNKQMPQRLKYPSIYQENLDCLAEEKDLNDIVIQFYLRYIYNEKLTPELQQRTYICDSFLYTRLLQDQGIDAEKKNTDTRKNKSTERAGGKKDPVEDWMKGVDLFSKDFILIPVNKKVNPNSNDPKGHWYLIIICNLSKLRKMPIYRDESETEVCNTETQSVIQQNSTLCQLTDERPCICFFDSVDDSKELSKEKEDVTKRLKNFLKRLLVSQISACNPVTETYHWKQLKPLKVICPQQTNEHDCGVFLLQFVESFFETRIANFQDEPNVKQWFNQDMIAGKRKIIKEIIEQKMAKR